MAKRYRILKYDGDDRYSYAVFHTSEVKGLTSPITYGQASPIVAGCSLGEASYHLKYLDGLPRTSTTSPSL